MANGENDDDVAEDAEDEAEATGEITSFARIGIAIRVTRAFINRPPVAPVIGQLNLTSPPLTA